MNYTISPTGELVILLMWFTVWFGVISLGITLILYALRPKRKKDS